MVLFPKIKERGKNPNFFYIFSYGKPYQALARELFSAPLWMSPKYDFILPSLSFAFKAILGLECFRDSLLCSWTPRARFSEVFNEAGWEFTV